MGEKTLKLCRYLAGAAMATSALGTLLGGNIGFDSLAAVAPIIFAISCLLMAGAMFSTNATLLGVGCGVRAVYLVFYVILYIKWELGFSDVLEVALQAVGFALLAVSLFQKKDHTQLLPIALIIGVVGICVGSLFYSGYDYTFTEKLANCMNSISNRISWDYLPILVGMLTLGGNALPVAVDPVAASPVQTAVGSSIERVTRLKELLDMGAISQEEFDEKKKEMLNL